MTSGRWAHGGRAVTELAVIVTGVLIALTADAWYERRSNLEIERGLLEDLSIEFRDNEARLRADIQTSRASLVAAEELLPLLALPVNDILRDSLQRLLPTVFRQARYDPNTGVLSSIIASGQLALIRDGTLRRELTDWLNRVEEVRLTFQNNSPAPAGFAEVLGQPPTPRTELVLRILWSSHLLGRRAYLGQMDELLEQTVAVSAILQAASTE